MGTWRGWRIVAGERGGGGGGGFWLKGAGVCYWVDPHISTPAATFSPEPSTQTEMDFEVICLTES